MSEPKKKKIRRFEIWVDQCTPGQGPTTTLVNLDAKLTDAEIEAICDEIVQDLIRNEIKSGWREICGDE